MSDKNFAFANIVSTPTADSWSQAYHAGKLFAVLSFKRNSPDEENETDTEKESLSSLGKTFFTALEQEFFTLEEKDLDSIKSAIEVSLKKIPEDVDYSLSAGSIIDDVFYLFCSNKGRIDFRRDSQTGALLISEDKTLKFASGRLQDMDMAILQTEQFNQLVDTEKLYSSLDHHAPPEIAENLAPHIHDKEEGGAAAIIIQYKKVQEEFYAVENFNPVKRPVEHKTIPEEEPLTAEPVADIKEKGPSLFSQVKKKIKLPGLGKITPSRKMILAVVVVIAVVLIGSIYLNKKHQNDAKTKALFNQVYPQAQSKYDEGQSLSDLNQSLAQDSYMEAKKILDQNKDKFPKGSDEENKINDLSQKVDKALGEASGASSTTTKEVSLSDSPTLELENKNNVSLVTSDGSTVYYLDGGSIFNSDKKEIIKDGWTNAVGLSTYFGNFYVLDKKEGILKFVKGGSSYSKSSYFSDSKPDLSSARSLAIDSSVYILLSDGKILKFTKGKADSFSAKALKPFLNPTRIFTNTDTENIYVLDKGSARIVVFDKTGVQKQEYKAEVIKNAQDFDVKEKDKKILVLSGGKIYQIDLK